MMIMTVDDVRQVLPFADPVAYCNLKSQETFGVIIIAIDLFPVQQSVYIHQVKFKPNLLVFSLITA
jgi:hypothetical protein